MKLPESKIEEILNSIAHLKKSIKLCSFCFNPFEDSGSENNFCPICNDKTRNKNILCIVEKESDLTAIEDIKKYKGLYFVLGGTLAFLKKDKEKDIRIKELEERIKNPDKFGVAVSCFSEIIIALNPTPEAESTALYIERKIKELSLSEEKKPKITRLGKGMPVGGELEYADAETLESALEGRK